MKDSNTIDSQSNGLFWGVDVASKKLDLGRHDRAEVVSFENSAERIDQLLAHVQERPVALIVVEATGGYEVPLVAALAEAGLPVARINPRQLRAFGTAVSASSGFTYQIVPNGLSNNAVSYIDRVFEWNDVPLSLTGQDYIKTREDDDFNSSLQVNVTLNAPGTLYLFFDNQYGPSSWVASNGFTDTGLDLGLDNSSGAGKNIVTTYSIFKKSVGAGTTTLFQAPLAPADSSMYGIAAAAAVPEPGAWLMLGAVTAGTGAINVARRARSRPSATSAG